MGWGHGVWSQWSQGDWAGGGGGVEPTQGWNDRVKLREGLEADGTEKEEGSDA